MTTKKTKKKTATKTQKIVLVDDHPIVRQGLVNLINQEPDLEVCGEADDAYQAIKVIADRNPDLAIIDISLEEVSGIELIKDIKVRYPSLITLALSMHDEFLYAERALRAGAKGYVMKHEATEKVVQAIRKVLGGDLFVSEKMAAKLVNKFVGRQTQSGISAIETLSDRELEVFTLIGRGYGTRQIADQLHLSIKTIETYRAHIKEKLNLASGPELLRHAIQWVNSQTAST